MPLVALGTVILATVNAVARLIYGLIVKRVRRFELSCVRLGPCLIAIICGDPKVLRRHLVQSERGARRVQIGVLHAV